MSKCLQKFPWGCQTRTHWGFFVPYALFVSTLNFPGKRVIFQKKNSRKLSHFHVFGSNLESELESFSWCLVCTICQCLFKCILVTKFIPLISLCLKNYRAF